jgi:4-hydroxy-tetrahydrodipicolinate synthase
MPSDLKQKFLKNVKGPVFPIPTPFTENGNVDYQGLETYVQFLLEKEVRTLMVTVGTSRFDVLTVEEMKKVNEAVVEATRGQAATMVTTPTHGPTSQAVDFARHAEDIGADGILAVYPERYYSDEDVFHFFEDITSTCSIGVLIHLMPIRAGRSGLGTHVHYSPDLVGRIITLENVVGIKEESHDQGLAYKYARLFGDRIVVIGGAGGMRAYLSAHQWGQPAYLVGIGNFVPEIELAFYAALEKGDYEGARRIVFDKEEPFFDASVRVGWHLALKEAMDYKGLMPAWERRPMARLSDQDQKLIRAEAAAL